MESETSFIQVLKFKQNEKNSLKGHFTVRFRRWGGLIIEDFAYFEKENKRWIAFPNKVTWDDKGEKKYVPFAFFEERKTMDTFQQKLLTALDEYLKNNTLQNQSVNNEPQQQELPF